MHFLRLRIQQSLPRTLRLLQRRMPMHQPQRAMRRSRRRRVPVTLVPSQARAARRPRRSPGSPRSPLRSASQTSCCSWLSGNAGVVLLSACLQKSVLAHGSGAFCLVCGAYEGVFAFMLAWAGMCTRLQLNQAEQQQQPLVRVLMPVPCSARP